MYAFNVLVLYLHVWLHARRGHQNPLYMVVSHHVWGDLNLGPQEE